MLSIFGLLGVCNAFTMRVCLNLAITQMVNKTKDFASVVEFDNTSEAACPSDIVSVNSTIVENPVSTFTIENIKITLVFVFHSISIISLFAINLSFRVW